MTEATPVEGWLTLEEVTSRYKPAWGDEPWEELWAKQLDGETGALIRSLAAELQERGSFDEPITLIEESWEHDEDTDEEEYYPACIGNGMHRIAAHHLTGIDPIFVRYGFPPFDEEEYDAGSTLMLTVQLLVAEGQDDLDVFDDLYERLSWRHKAGLVDGWVRVEGGFGRDNQWELHLAEVPDNVDLTALREDIANRVVKLGEVLKLEWVPNREDDEE